MKFYAYILIATTLVGCANSHLNLNTQAHVDLIKYMGQWHEQARLPNRFQADCASDVQANYEPSSTNTITVINQCRKENGSIEIAKGEARLATPTDSRSQAKLQVRFAPKWLSWLPFVWVDYWILKLEGNYEYSLVGTPDRKYLWVLSRNKKADPALVKELLDYAQAQGFDTSHIIWTLNNSL